MKDHNVYRKKTNKISKTMFMEAFPKTQKRSDLVKMAEEIPDIFTSYLQEPFNMEVF